MKTKLFLETLQIHIDTVNLFGEQKSRHFTSLRQNRLTSSKLIHAWESIAKLSCFSSNGTLTLDGDGEYSTAGSETSRQGKWGARRRIRYSHSGTVFTLQSSTTFFPDRQY